MVKRRSRAAFVTRVTHSSKQLKCAELKYLGHSFRYSLPPFCHPKTHFLLHIKQASHNMPTKQQRKQKFLWHRKFSLILKCFLLDSVRFVFNVCLGDFQDTLYSMMRMVPRKKQRTMLSISFELQGKVENSKKPFFLPLSELKNPFSMFYEP